MDNQPQNKVVSKLFNIIDLTAVNKRAKKVKVDNTKKTVNKTVKKKEGPVIDFDRFLSSQPGSVQAYINECHPDVLKFIRENEPISIKGEPGKLIILTRNKFRVEITDTGIRKRRVSITDRKGEKLFDEITELLSQVVTLKK